ncbi:MAG: sulfite reductase, ferredoxin dependent [Microcystis sp. M114S2]|jgi:sulfite reductase (ferredoxin)|uniref:sulfite reductase, ferredoxin dependent n=1 Tax=unclassified Microcystis TaxID=2643300 RepID=UPI0025857015|nr:MULTISPECIES: sulfite reductase, ferredoxin dependent [unclassified Microcystis]NCR77618.1 sulfite reductase, ferredoxin dependent [Microcystis aeruginosa K13-06]MCA2668088.1 sulfite reductase, ferredoxin dependent [Microcystis sp. M045S2]MCA2712166.1 sulfite reductase, ferredoxin dependent [Microcystis sp. M172S2]MCA2806729.1 sulfite reductase, ferredoxin dependent [Microcystis sp. M114S2]MCA2832294.1 sulfite reductase, ferredoxin dependent [Microcystis sp. M007S1]
MVTTPISPTAKVSKVEGIKERSNYLREPLASELLEDTTHFTDAAVQILKFHGSYQQDNRDHRAKGQEKDYQMMLRTRSPGGFIPAQLYLTLDSLSDRYGNGTLRVTTRQGFQLHGILKKNLKATLGEIIRSMGSTLAACGDVNRNVTAPPAPYKNRPEYGYAWEYANNIADLLTPQTGAYYEIWLDGEKVISAEEAPEVKTARQKDTNGINKNDPIEPIYGQHYMPRKFKIGVAVPGDNSIDIYTNDLGLVVITDANGELQGFNILAGGGLGRTHNKEETFPRMADAIGYVDKENVYDLVKAIVATQRDYGDRGDRRHARMKYILEEWGVEKFRSTVEGYFGQKIAPYQPLPDWKYQDFLGWNEQGDGKLFFGLSVENGRVKNEGSFQLKTALKVIIERFQLPMRLTANHNIILYEIEPQDQQAIEAILKEHGIITDPAEIDPLTRYAMACPAWPTCGLAITESERILPQVIERIRALLNRLGLSKEQFVIRMTGCPNGCARPYMAELGFVGSAPNSYQLWLGGTADQTRLARPYLDKMAIDDLEKVLEPIFVYFQQDQQNNETFGEFCHRVNFPALQAFSATYTPKMTETTTTESKPKRVRKNQNRVSVPDDMFVRLKEASETEKRPMNQIINEALEAYFSQKS